VVSLIEGRTPTTAVFPNAKFIRLADTPGELIDNPRGEPEIFATSALALDAIVAAAGNRKPAVERAWTQGLQKRHRDRSAKAGPGYTTGSDGGVDPRAIFQALREKTNTDYIAIADGGGERNHARDRQVEDRRLALAGTLRRRGRRGASPHSSTSDATSSGSMSIRRPRVVLSDLGARPHPAGPAAEEGSRRDADTVIGPNMQRHRHQEFIRFLNASSARFPLEDNPRHHRPVRRWRARHPRWTFHFTPTSASWLNAVEGFFAVLTKRRLMRGVFRSVADLQAAINRFFDDHKPTQSPSNGSPIQTRSSPPSGAGTKCWIRSTSNGTNLIVDCLLCAATRLWLFII
jgi:hypothetical protein